MDDKTTNNEKPSRKKMLIILTIVMVILVGIIVLIIVLATSGKSTDSSSVTEIDSTNSSNSSVTEIDIGNWSNKVILSQDIDLSGLEHGIIYKQLNLSSTDSGIHRINFDQYYEYNGPVGYTQTWLNAQSRTVYNYALSYENIKDERFLKYAINGMNAVFKYFHDPVFDGYFRSIILYDNGTLIIDNPEKDTYQHEFLIKALAKLYQVTLNETYLNEAMKIYKMLWTNFTDSTGVGIYPSRSRDFVNVTSSGRNTDPMLHFFHSSLKLYEALKTFDDNANDKNDTLLMYMKDKINKIYDFVMSIRANVTITNENDEKVTYSVFCLEYDDAWKPVDDISIIDNIVVGHGFEFSLFIWYFMDLDVITKTNENIINANDLFKYSVDLSYNESTGSLDFLYHNVSFDSVSDTFYWWHRTQWWMGIEAIRTIVYYNYNYNDSWMVLAGNDFYDHDYIKELQQNSLNWYNDTFYDPQYGGIYGQPSTQDYRKGHEWKVGYHTIEDCIDILNIMQFQFS